MGNMMFRFGRFVAKVLPEDWDWWTIFSGFEGTGKSSLSIWWAHYVSGKLFQVDEHICYDAEEFLRLVDDAPRYGSIIMDEAAEVWFNRDFASKANKALAKAATQIRDRNLNVILNLPSIFLLDASGIRRHRTWVDVTAPAFVRGKSEWYKPNFKTYSKNQLPYWDLKFIQYFVPLPDKVDQTYRVMKTAKAKERLAGYIEQIVAEKAKDRSSEVGARELIERIAKEKDRDRYTNSRGTFDRDKIALYAGCKDSVARQVAKGLNDLLSPS